MSLTLVSPNTLAAPLPRDFTAVAAADLQPAGVTFSAPVRVTLPVQGEVAAGQLVVLLRLDDTTGTYEQVGLGRVSADGTVIDTLSGGLTQFSTVVFAAADELATKIFLLPVAGNQQQAQPGEELPEPLVVRLEDQFGNPVVGQSLRLTITQGEGSILAADPVTDANGEARFRVQIGASDDDLLVRVNTPDLPDVRPVQFFAIIGELDTPFIPRDVAVAGDIVYVADRRSGLLVIDAHEPTRPQLPLTRTGLTIANAFAYVTRGVFGLEALDIRDVDAPRRVGLVNTPSEALHVATAGNVLYVIDSIFGLQVIQGPDARQTDTDGDGSIDFFDAFPTNPAETQDSDGDRVGDNADPDDDNDGFTDAEEAMAMPPTHPKGPLSFPLRVPLPEATTIIVDAATSLTAQARQGTPGAPYHSITEALRALRSGQVPAVDTLVGRAGIYSPLTTQEIIPLDLSRLSHLTMQAEVPGTVVLDGGFRGNVVNAAFSEALVLDGFVVIHGESGLSVHDSAQIILRNNQVRDHDEHGVLIGPNADTGIEITDNLVEINRDSGIVVTGNSAATITHNTMRTNGVWGIVVWFGSTAEIRDNVTERNGQFGIIVMSNSTATITENTSAQNEFEGIVIFDNSTATVTRNILRANRNDGIVIDINSTAMLRDNTIEGNGFPPNLSFPDFLLVKAGNGVVVAGGSEVTISGGVIAHNRRHGIRVFVSPLDPTQATPSARVGLDSDAIVKITDNGGAGIFVDDDGSLAELDNRQIVFDGNVEGDTVGNVVDVVPGP